MSGRAAAGIRARLAPCGGAVASHRGRAVAPAARPGVDWSVPVVLAPLALAAALVLGAGASRADEVDALPIRYACEFGARIDLALDPRGDQLFGQLHGRPVLMGHAPSASGARYVENETGDRGGRLELWMKGDRAMLNWLIGEDSRPLLEDCIAVK